MVRRNGARALHGHRKRAMPLPHLRILAGRIPRPGKFEKNPRTCVPCNAGQQGSCWTIRWHRTSITTWDQLDGGRQTMHRGAKLIAVLGSVSAVAACTAAPPSGPTVMALPPNGKSLDAFQQEDGQCRNYAAAAIGPYQPARAGARAAVGSAATGTVLGAAAGSAIGAAAGNAGGGAAIGGAAGLVGSTAVGANNVAASQYDLQTRYNIAYTQCVYSRGDTVQYWKLSTSLHIAHGATRCRITGQCDGPRQRSLRLDRLAKKRLGCSDIAPGAEPKVYSLSIAIYRTV